MLSLYFVQIAFNDDDGSNRDQDLVSLWESFQPHVVAVSRKSPFEVLMELELLEGEVSNEVKEGEEWEDKTREDVEERSGEEVFEEDADHFDQKEDSNLPHEKEALRLGKSPGKKTVSFASQKLLFQVHHLDDDEEVSF